VTPGVVLVTDPLRPLEQTARVVRWAAAALGPGGLLVQLRDKVSDAQTLAVTARALREVTREAQAVFVVNGPAVLARAVAADGVHLPSVGPLAGASLLSRVAEVRAVLGAQAFVSAAAHDDDELRAADLAGATAALVSPIFTTPGKGPARGVAAISAARSLVDASRRTPPLLVYALGGVTAENAAACRKAGADAVAVIRALYDATGEPAVQAAAQALSARPRP
jgi:thiamine-phosphate pyrophosphorylase